MVTLTYMELGLVVSLGMFAIVVTMVVAQLLGCDDILKNIAIRLQKRLRAGQQRPNRQSE